MKRFPGAFSLSLAMSLLANRNASPEVDAVVNLTVDETDYIASGNPDQVYFEGAPITLSLRVGKDPSSAGAGKAELYAYYLAPSFPIAVEVLDGNGALVFESLPKVARRFSCVYVRGESHWFALECFLLDERLVSGSYTLRFKALHDWHLAIRRFDPSEVSISVKKPVSNVDRYVRARQRAFCFGKTLELDRVVECALEMEREAPGCREPALFLAGFYSFWDPPKALAFQKELARRYMSAAPVHPNQWAKYTPQRDLSPSIRRKYTELAIRSGEARTKEEATKQLDDFISDLHEGKVPALDPLSMDREEGTGAATSLALILGIAVGTLGGGSCVWLLMRYRRTRQAIPNSADTTLNYKKE